MNQNPRQRPGVPCIQRWRGALLPRYLLSLVWVLVIASWCGCNWFKGLAFILPEPKRAVPAEFAHLKGSVLVMVWARPETLYDYPNARLEVASHIVDALQAHRPGVRCIDVFKVEDYVDQRGYGVVDPERAGKHFQTRYVIYLELLSFAFRDPRVPELLQGHIGSSVVVYDLADPGLPARRFELAPVDVLFPESGPILFSQSRTVQVRKGTYETFAGTVAKKFYDHEVIVE